MKKATLLVLILLSGTFSLFAQNKPESGAGFVFGISGINNIGVSAPMGTGTLGFRYKMASGITGRLNLNLQMASIKHENSDSSDLGAGAFSVENKFSQTNFNIAIGAQKSFTGTDNLDPYIGADLSFGTNNSGKSTHRTDFTNADSTFSPYDATGDFDETEINYGKGMSIGLTPFIGFNYFFLEKMSIGAEFGWGLNFSTSKGGEMTVSSQHTFNDGVNPAVVTTTNTTTTFNDKDTNMGLGTHGYGSLLVTIFF